LLLVTLCTDLKFLCTGQVPHAQVSTDGLPDMHIIEKLLYLDSILCG